MRWLGCLASLLMFQGCASDGERTIGDLDRSGVRVERGALPNADLQAAIKSYREFLAQAPANHPLYNDAMMRLADLEMQNGEQVTYQEFQRQYAEAVAATEALEREANQDAYQDAIAKYESLLSRNPDDPRADWVLYQLARAYESNGQPEAALKALDRLVLEHPDSQYFLEAQFRRAELYFTIRRYQRAQRAYEYVLKHQDAGQFYQEALYKHGWSLFKQERYEQALVSFFAMYERLGIGDPQRSRGGGRVQAQMREDIQRAVNLCFSYLGGADAVDRFFAQRKEQRYEYLVYGELGNFFMQREHISDAADTFKAFVDRHPDHPRAPELYRSMIEAYEKGKFYTLALRAKEDFARRYGKSSAYWQAQSPEVRVRLEAPLRATLKELARYYHAKAQRMNQPRYRQRALHWYEAYVQSFPAEPDTARMNFLLAEGLYEQGAYDEAARQYDSTAYQYPPHDNAAEAGYAALLAYDKHAERVRGEAADQVRQQWVESALRFVETYPANEHVATIQANLAETLFRLKAYDRALAVAQQMLEGKPRATEHQLTAHTVIAHIAFDRSDFLLAQSHYQHALKLAPRNDGLRPQLEKRLASAVYKQAEQQRASGDAQGAAQGFLKVSALSPGTQIAATAAFDAATALLAAEEWERAIDVLQRFRTEFPRHRLAPRATEKLAVAHEKAGNNEAAGKLYLAIARDAESEDLRREAHWHGADLLAREGAVEKAAAAFKGYIYDFPRPLDQGVAARERLIALYDQLGEGKKSNYWRRELIEKVPPKSNNGGSVRAAAARAALALAKATHAQFDNAALVNPLKESLRRKRQWMKQALSAYDQANAYGVAAVTTEATYHIAGIYQAMGKSLLTAEAPGGLTGAELEQYRLLLEEQAYPFEEKAIAIHEANTRRARQGLYDQWVARSFAALQALRPARYAKEEVSDVAFAAIN